MPSNEHRHLFFIYRSLLTLQQVTINPRIGHYSNIGYKHYTCSSAVTLENVTKYGHYKPYQHNKNDR